jgi:hypothetical protein
MHTDIHTSSAPLILDDANEDADAVRETFRAAEKDEGSLRMVEVDAFRAVRSAALDSRSRALSLYPTEEEEEEVFPMELLTGSMLLLALLSLLDVIKCLE